MINQIKDTVIHKQYFLNSAKMLIDAGYSELAIKLIRRAGIHDNSKFSMREIDCLSKISDLQNDDDGFTNPDYKLNSAQEELIKIHWQHNRHHPEFFNNINEMRLLDILEMICDWHARSVEYSTDLLEFVTKRQKTRFHFDSVVFSAIYYICNAMVEESNKKKSQ